MALQNIADKTIIAAAKKERNVIDEDSFTEVCISSYIKFYYDENGKCRYQYFKLRVVA